MIRQYKNSDLEQMTAVWNEVVEEGIAFPQEECLTKETALSFFSSQSYCGVSENEKNEISGLYILHPNNVGRCSHICNASFAVSSSFRGQHIGEKLVKDCIKQAKSLGFKIMQFNAVVSTNIHARHLYERLGFKALGEIPNGFRMKNGEYANIIVYYLAI